MKGLNIRLNTSRLKIRAYGNFTEANFYYIYRYTLEKS